MSRVENNLKKQGEKYKLKKRMKIAFVLLLIINVSICILIIDYNAKNMLGEKNILSEVVDKTSSSMRVMIKNTNDIYKNISKEIEEKLGK
ncbi:hypothetical protein CHL78_000535 [Romboutsia weinsteinii]|uniref:Uncharacterized protein n=1 Tax=Romboutsia weinsteinii TaxID=2020949 RepID=A0A371JA91_9FIRM|nr:hypothetical protein [Romboutsia weinsteinii]RDY29689.1 hypothetical protein CHL78_000535 [Romboutsia weinsteinii]